MRAGYRFWGRRSRARAFPFVRPRRTPLHVTLSMAQSAGVTLPQPLTLTPVTPVVAPLVHYV